MDDSPMALEEVEKIFFGIKLLLNSFSQITILFVNSDRCSEQIQTWSGRSISMA